MHSAWIAFLQKKIRTCLKLGLEDKHHLLEIEILAGAVESRLLRTKMVVQSYYNIYGV